MSPDSKRRSLGMGLSALLGEDADDDGLVARKPARTVPIEQIHPSRYQPRRVFDDDKLAALAQSIREKGILQPLLVRVHHTIPNAFELIAGERRWRAAQKAQLHDVPVIIRDLSDRETLEIALVENLQREDLNPLEEAEAYVRLTEEFHHSQEDLARAVSRSRSHVANTMRLLGASDKIKSYLHAGKLSAGHVRALIGAAAADRLADEIVRRGLSVRQTEMLVQKPPRSSPAKASTPRDVNILNLEQELAGKLGLEVKLKPAGAGGELVIRYGSLDQLDGVLARLR